ncbi:hypothetical protein GGX14DRAFT_557417 [Mycena pura]|uniref:Uncharacterized protein n=1 Tax=Mycena pura TaxID=153505 RepID=A0AAD7E2B7_9AGAR|nr:hypothetical protein GGX14DRAFT_557417 [Mycena pura]
MVGALIKFKSEKVQKLFFSRTPQATAQYSDFHHSMLTYIAIVAPIIRALWSLEAAHAMASDPEAVSGIPRDLANKVTSIYNKRYIEFFENELYFVAFCMDPPAEMCNRRHYCRSTCHVTPLFNVRTTHLCHEAAAAIYANSAAACTSVHITVFAAAGTIELPLPHIVAARLPLSCTSRARKLSVFAAADTPEPPPPPPSPRCHGAPPPLPKADAVLENFVSHLPFPVFPVAITRSFFAGSSGTAVLRVVGRPRAASAAPAISFQVGGECTALAGLRGREEEVRRIPQTMHEFFKKKAPVVPSTVNASATIRPSAPPPIPALGNTPATLAGSSPPACAARSESSRRLDRLLRELLDGAACESPTDVHATLD